MAFRVSHLAAWLTGATLAGLASPALAAPDCATLAKWHLAPAAIGLPTQGASIESAEDAPAQDDLPAMCRVIGTILPTGPGTAPVIRFQVNLPQRWNGKALQFGGGGFDGVLVDGLHAMPGNGAVTPAIPNPLARGYATFGSDGGHQATDPADATFLRNPLARANYAGEAVKRVHDVAFALIAQFYGQTPRRSYFAGASKGGQEALVAAQRYGKDYDGVIAYYPAKDAVALVFGWHDLLSAAYGPDGGAMDPQKQAWFKQAVISVCDALDGASDGIIANQAACAATVSTTTWLCPPNPVSTAACLTSTEARMIERAQRRLVLPFMLANGVVGFGPFPVFSGAATGGLWFSPQGPDATAFARYANGIVRNAWTRDDNASFDQDAQRAAMLAWSREADATSPNIDRLATHGGKLILVQGATDMLVPPAATTDYYLRLAARYGAGADDLVRYYVQPGYGHGEGEFRLAWDSLAALDDWVENGTPPNNLVAIDANPVTRNRQMPLCAYPSFPRYHSGDPRLATSYRCETQ